MKKFGYVVFSFRYLGDSNYERSEAGLSGRDLESIDIYDGVISDGKSDLVEFL